MYISLREMVHKKNVQKLSWENMQKEEKSLVQTVVGEMIRNSIPKTIFVKCLKHKSRWPSDYSWFSYYYRNY